MTIKKTIEPRAVSVKYLVTSENGWSKTENHYNFLTNIEDLAVNDIAVVESDSSRRYSLVEIVSLEPSSTVKATKWIIDRVDIAAHKERKERERQKADIKRKMEAMRKEMDEDMLLAMYAEKNPEFNILFKQYQEL
jgi:hypothetical protein